ncbi:hypothetical protein ACLOJK_016103 [Asimina triloba]
MADNRIRFGILGCARIARKVSRAIILSPNATIQAIGSRSLDTARKFAAENGFSDTVTLYGSYGEVLDDPRVDAVYVPLPTSLHLEWAVVAAEKKKHVLLEKPTALRVSDLDQILGACQSNGVQFMDGTMWMHHPRTHKMREMLSSPTLFGQLKAVIPSTVLGILAGHMQFLPSLVHSTFGYFGDSDFLEKDVRVNPDLDSLGALGDVGWYCIRAILWAADYQLPKTVAALPDPVFNKAGVVLTCGASLQWEDGKTATFLCSFQFNLAMDVTVLGTKGTLHLHDFVIPFQESSAKFSLASQSGFNDLATGWTPMPGEHAILTELPQEALMVKEFSSLVASIRDCGSTPDVKWSTITRKTQLILDAVKASLDKDCVPVDIAD